VAKLLIQCAPDVAVFGEKDYQQLQMIRRLVADLDLPVEIAGGAIVRAESGLALSSRNAYLSDIERGVAERLNVILAAAVKALRHGVPIDSVEATGLAALKTTGFDRVDYFEVRDAETLARLETAKVEGAARILAAAVVGKTRLIDNMAV
jgi:pantoate--beta-alanine ligase